VVGGRGQRLPCQRACRGCGCRLKDHAGDVEFVEEHGDVGDPAAELTGLTDEQDAETSGAGVGDGGAPAGPMTATPAGVVQVGGRLRPTVPPGQRLASLALLRPRPDRQVFVAAGAAGVGVDPRAGAGRRRAQRGCHSNLLEVGQDVGGVSWWR